MILEHQRLLDTSEHRSNAVYTLLLLKQAIHSVSQRMQREQEIGETNEIEDQLGWTMVCIRAAERVDVRRVEQCVHAYPHLKTILGHLNTPTTTPPTGLISGLPRS